MLCKIHNRYLANPVQIIFLLTVIVKKHFKGRVNYIYLIERTGEHREKFSKNLHIYRGPWGEQKTLFMENVKTIKKIADNSDNRPQSDNGIENR